MRLNTFLLFFTCLPCLLFAQINQIDDLGRKQGEWSKTYKNGVAKYEGSFKDDVPVGTFKYYYPNGKLKTELSYRSADKSYAVHYYTNGKKQSEGLYIEQKKDSTWTFYNESGEVASREQYRNDMRHGVSISYYPDGKIASETQYKDDLIHGTEKTFFEGGQLQMERSYSNGVAQGIYKVLNIKGNPVLQGKYEKGEEVGEWRVFDKDGVLEQRIIKRGPRQDSIIPVNGEYIIKYANGMPQTVANYKHEKLHGEYLEYYDNGRWVVKSRLDPRSGEEDQYQEMEGHTIKKRCNYVFGKKNGKCTEYFEDGKIKKVQEYQMGELVK
ncbi:MAG: toxin-antitoxin system YwqK family antitoxin [Luteibaculum sp.]